MRSVCDRDAMMLKRIRKSCGPGRLPKPKSRGQLMSDVYNSKVVRLDHALHATIRRAPGARLTGRPRDREARTTAHGLHRGRVSVIAREGRSDLFQEARVVNHEESRPGGLLRAELRPR